MPGPGSRGKSRQGAKKSTPTTRSNLANDDVFICDIDDVLGWKVLIDRLCEFFKLPDLGTRGGMKKIHANFDEIYARMEKLYQESGNNIKVQGAIVGLFAKMSIDSILRNKLFEKDTLNKIIPLLHEDETRHLALRALNIITHHGGSSVRVEIAKHANDVTKLIRDLPDDDTVIELGVSTLTHSIMAAVEGLKSPTYPEALASINMVEVLKTTMEVVKRPHPNSHSIVAHAIELLSVSSLQAAAAFKAYPTAINFLAAGMRSKDWSSRCICLGGLIKLNLLDAYEDELYPDPYRFNVAINSRMPHHLADIMQRYGSTKGNVHMTIFCSSESTEAMLAYAQNRDLYALGLKQASLVVQTEYSITAGAFEDHADHVDMPFVSWTDSLPFTAKAIREKGKPDERDLADILDMKYLVISQRLPEALEMAKKGIERNPEQAYFHYILSLSGNPVQGLRSAKKGLKCKKMTPFVKYQMLQRAVDHAARMGLHLFQDMPDPSEPSWKEAVAFLMSAVEDAKAYIDSAPPDNRYMRNVCSWYILLSVLVKPDISPELRELDDALKRLSIANQFSEFFGFSPSKNETTLAQQVVVKYYPLGVKEFSKVFENFDKAEPESATTVVDRKKADDDLAEWLEDIRLEDGTMQVLQRCDGYHRPGSSVNEEEFVTMYRCSWCRNPSAVLRKCSGCGQMRYCDSSCQRAHWKEHKKVCGLQT
ncbi:hypothetical protein GALMADRAFT_101649 [Galerina marginata CBS 339.88]|uniref:MYND-type domain-containing protein n=1 Tax=Galerina marginata (strain CBS 339.88) TaxID=685588 RepID=A0A067T0J9_GALM3|nr:hypothetical protein GALMADRAFT_101649 [Galerina marginata CBS 339.88]